MLQKNKRELGLALFGFSLLLTAAISSERSHASDIPDGTVCVVMINSERDPRTMLSSTFSSTYSCDGRTPAPLTPVSGSSFPQEVSGQLAKFVRAGQKLIGCEIHRASEAPTIRTQYICTFTRQ